MHINRHPFKFQLPLSILKTNNSAQKLVKMENATTPDSYSGDVVRVYPPLPPLYVAFMLIWFFSAFSWAFNTYNYRHFQTNKLQWTLAAVPSIKALQLALSCLFWNSCLYAHVCSLWMSFGVYVIGVLLETSTLVSFMLISNGYCITCERLSVSERRTTAALGCVFYLTLVGYRASIPYFFVPLLLNYIIIFYMIFYHVSQNLIVLREQLSFIEDEDVQAMHDAVYTKYIMFKKFQGAMHIMAVAELAIFINMDTLLENYWIRLLIREWIQFCIFLYVGWTFRSQQLTAHFSVMPALKSKVERTVPPIYSIEMDAETFKDLSSHEWHIGVPTMPCKGKSVDSVLVVIQQPSDIGHRPTLTH